MGKRVAYLKSGGVISLRPDLLGGAGTGGMAKYWLFHVLNHMEYEVDIISAVDVNTRRNPDHQKEMGYRVNINPGQLDFSVYDLLIVEVGVQNLRFEDGFLKMPQLVRTFDILKNYEGPCLFMFTDRLLKFVWRPECLKGSLWEPYKDMFSEKDLQRNKKWYVFHLAQRGDLYYKHLLRGEASGLEGTGYDPRNSAPMLYALPFKHRWCEPHLQKSGRMWDFIIASSYKEHRQRMFNELFEGQEDVSVAIYGKWSEENINEFPIPVRHMGTVSPLEVVKVMSRGKFYINALTESAGKFGWQTNHRDEGYLSGCLQFFHRNIYGAENNAIHPKMIVEDKDSFWDATEWAWENWNALAFAQVERAFQEYEPRFNRYIEMIERILKGQTLEDVSAIGCLPRPDKLVPMWELEQEGEG